MLNLVWASFSLVDPHSIIFIFPSAVVWINTYPTPFSDASVNIIEFAEGSNGSRGMFFCIASLTSSRHFWCCSVH